MSNNCLIKTGLMLLVTILFIFSALTPMVIGYNVRASGGGHTFEIKITRSGEETVLYDGEPVSSKMTRFGGTHEFSS